ncbi:MAG: hypothetical protein ACRDKI_09995 [Solirubrobacterales bacterium]
MRVSTDLPVAADRAFELAHKLALFEYVVWPVLRLAVSDEQRALAADPEGFSIGDDFSARLWFFQVIPAWMHHLKIVADGDLELYTNERSGPARLWNHRLTFVPTGESSCRYTDAVEIEGGPLGLGTAVFIHVFFRYRQWRWRQLTRVLA